MIKKLIRHFHKKRQRKMLYSVLRGYQLLESSYTLGILDALKEDLYNTKCVDAQKFQSSFLGEIDVDKEVVIRQYLTLRLVDVKFSSALLYSISNPSCSLNFPLPPLWRDVVRKHGFKVDQYHAKWLWMKFVFSKYIYGVLRGFWNIYKSLRIVNSNKEHYGSYIFFAGLTKKSLPGTEPGGRDIFNWFYNWDTTTRRLDNFFHDISSDLVLKIDDVVVKSISSPILPLYTFSKIWKYSVWLVKSVFTSLSGMFSGEWWNLLMLAEVADAKMIQEADSDALARKYLFHNSNWVYRPVWSYEAEKKGSQIFFYFYSTNIEPFQISNNPRLPVIGWKFSTWPNYLVWDEFQKRYLERVQFYKSTKIITGPISIYNGSDFIFTIPENSAAVFDVQPVRDAYYRTLGIEFDYFVPETCNKFLTDVYQVLSEFNFEFVHKRKRNIGKVAHYKYRNLLKDFELKEHYVVIDPEISAEEIIKQSKFVVSMPFTSTGILAETLGKPSCYYDSTGFLRKSDPGAHGIEIISSLDELYAWVDRIQRSTSGIKQGNSSG